jgi:hypothetical protein
MSLIFDPTDEDKNTPPRHNMGSIHIETRETDKGHDYTSSSDPLEQRKEGQGDLGKTQEVTTRGDDKDLGKELVGGVNQPIEK